MTIGLEDMRGLFVFCTLLLVVALGVGLGQVRSL